MRDKIYCIGFFRTGTNSVYEMFKRSFRSEHEFMLLPTLQAIRQYAQQDPPQKPQLETPLTEFVRMREAALELDLDSSGLNYALLEAILAVRPQSKFILTIRDCYSWLNSSIGTMYRANGRPTAMGVRDFVNSAGHTAGGDMRWTDRSRYKLCLEQMVKTWVAVNTYVIRTAPPSRLLVLKTGDLGQAVPAVARFAGVPEESLDSDHANSGLGVNYLKCFEPEEIEAIVQRHGSRLMADLFPEINAWQPLPANTDLPSPDRDAVRRMFSVDRFELRET